MIAASSWLNLTGLVLNIIGTALLLKFGPPPSAVIQEGDRLLEIVADDAQPEVARAFERGQRIFRLTLGVIFVGFALQLGGAIVQMLAQNSGAAPGVVATSTR